MTLPTLRNVNDLMAWSGQLVAELERQRTTLDRAYLVGDLLSLPPREPSRLPDPKRPGLVVTVRDGTDGVLLLVSDDAGHWRRSDTYAVYP